MGKSGVRNVDSFGGTVLKCPSSPPLTSSTLNLKEQLELIHQIIQQTTEESVIFTTGANLRTGLHCPPPYINSKSPVKKTVCVTTLSNSSCKNVEKVETSVGGGSNVVAVGGVSGDELNLNVGVVGGAVKGDDKPVECAICCRRFKNTPALNGHMRLHGGYFKKESDGKKKEPTTKETQGTPLQTASVSVRALIEEKIIQRRNNSQGGSGSSSTASTPKTSPATSAPTTPTKTANSRLSPSVVSGTSSLFIKTEPQFSKNIFQNQTFPFDDLLNEEEVFNQVSSICPDSFFSGIDESLLCESGIGTGSDSSQISTEFFNWSASTHSSSSNNGVHSLFCGPGTPTTSSSGAGSDNPFTPLPSIDPVFFTPTPGSAHSYQSQGEDLADSPSFIYPTPPASLESHNALQSPLFPYPFPFEASPQSGNHNLMTSNSQLVMIPPSSATTTKSPSINSSTGCLSSTAIFLPASSTITSMGTSTLVNSFLLTAANPQIQGNDPPFSSVSGSVMFCNGATGGNQSDGSNPNQSKCSSSLADIKPLLLPPPLPSPSITPSSNLLTTSFSGTGNHPLSQMKGNEPCPITGDSEESFRSPSRIFTLSVNTNSGSNAPTSNKVPKRKALRNTLASNLRPQSTQSLSHFTPYPILSPVRSAPGLFWTFSSKLTHVDEIRKDRPRINIGANFQAIIPPLANNSGKKDAYYLLPSCEDLLWSPETVNSCFQENVDKYLEFACCSAIPGGGSNKEYALHILHHCRGDINSAMLLLMSPDPKLPTHLQQFKYPESEKWSRAEILKIQESLLRHGKDFREVSKELGTKSGEACVSFYQWWKKVCPNEYERIRGVWKKREAAFTIELLKNIPAPLVQTHTHATTGSPISKSKQTKPQQPSPASSRGLGLNEEFPCKICGKIFSKVKSRSAHMKSHRPPPTPPSTSPAPVLSPASAATLMENKEKIADALQKHIFGKANAKTLQSNSAPSTPTTPTQTVAPFMPKIVKVEACQQNQPEATTPPPQPLISTPTTTTPSSCFQQTPTAHPLQLQAT